MQIKRLQSVFIIALCFLFLSIGTHIVYANDECNITIDKKCAVVPVPFDCDDARPIDSLSMIWDGTMNIDIKAWKGNVGSILLEEIKNIAPGEEVTVTGFAGSPYDIYWEIFSTSNGTKIGESTFHLSCSDNDMNGPEDCDKYEGDGKYITSDFINDWLFQGMAGNGLILDCTPAELIPSDECESVATPPNCDILGKPTSLTFLYTGASCLASQNDQASDKWDCSGEPGAQPVSITIVKDSSTITVCPLNEIYVGDMVTVSAIESDMGSEIQLDLGGQSLKIHTSCSQPLAVGDVFGSLELVKFNGKVSGAEVTYFYEVKNIGDDVVDITSVFDDMLGQLLASNFPLTPNESLTIEKTAYIEETTTNEVIVNSLPCATDQVTVTVNEPTLFVAVDIKPGSDPNCINPNSKGSLAVAILCGDAYDVNNIDPSTIELDGILPLRWSLNKDVNGDGCNDLVFHFSTRELDAADLLVEDKILTITGELLDGRPISGSDIINLAGGLNCF